MIENFLRVFRRKSVVTTSQISFSEYGDPKRSPRDYQGFTEEGYRKNVIAYRCIHLIAGSVGAIPWLLYKKQSDGNKKEITSHDVLTLLRRPNPRYTESGLKRQMVSFLCIAGNSYLKAVGPDRPKAKPLQLWALRPDQMRAKPGPNGLPERYIYRPNHQDFEFPVNPVTGGSPILHWKTFNPQSEWQGMSPIEAAALAIDTLNDGAVWNLKLLQNGARPTMVITTDKEMSLNANQVEKLKRDIHDAHSGKWNAGKPMLLSHGLDAKPVSWSPQDMEFLNSKNTNEKDVALAFSVPGQLVGVKDSQTFANWKEARMAFYEDTVIPMTAALCEEMTNWLLPVYGDDSLCLGYDENCIEALEPKRAERWARAKEAPWLTTNEKRELCGYGKYEGGEDADAADQILVPAAQVPLEVAAAPIDSEAAPEDEPESEDEPDLGEDDGQDEGEDKALNLSTDAAKLAHARALTRTKLAQARSLEAKIKKAFKSEASTVKEKLAGVSLTYSIIEFQVEAALAKSRPSLRAIFTAELHATAKVFGKPILELGKSQPNPSETKSAEDRFEFSIRRFVEDRATDATESILRTNKKKLLRRLKEAIEERDEDGHIVEVSLAHVVDEAYDSFKSRAELISRTETHIASEEANRAAAKALQIPNLQKEWVAVHDDRTRDSHVDQNGVIIPFDEKFQVKTETGSESMDGPGDKHASLANLVNCRCTLVYHTKE